MNLKHLSTEFEYFYPKIMFGIIQLEIIAYIFI